MPIEQQQSGSVEPATQVFAKITIEEATVPATTPVTPAPAAPTAAAPATAATVASAASERQSKSLTRRLARRILGPTLMTKK